MALNLRSMRLPAIFFAMICSSACGAPRNMPMSYGYGDMFDEDDSGGYAQAESGRRDGGGDYDMDGETIAGELESSSYRVSRDRHSPPPPPAPPASMSAMREAAPMSAMMDEAPMEMAEEVAVAPEPMDAPEPSAPATSPASTETEPGAAETDTAASEREAPLMIYEAGLTMAVNDVRAKIDDVAAASIEIGGYIVRQDDTSIVVRVPAGRFREALLLFEAMGDVLDRRIAAQDVSEAVRDLRIRLQNAEQMRDRLIALLAEAETVQESLVIERELERLNETIELIRGALNSLGERIAFSTVTVTFQPIQIRREVPHQLFRLPFSWLDELGLANLLSL